MIVSTSIKWLENIHQSCSIVLKVWNVEGEGRKLGILVRTLLGHGHRVNTLALSCEAVLRTGPFGKEACALKASSTFTAEEAQTAALERYNLAR